MSTFLLRFILVTMAFMLASPASAAPGDREFKQGITAFKARHYQQAISAFKKAQQKGKKSSALTYNLGVSYYKSAQYTQAKQSFSQLLNDRQFRQLAQYNLGLVNLAQQNKPAAIDRFRQAADKHGDPKITALANRMLRKYAPPKTQHRISGLLSLGYGHDSNVTLASTGSPTQQSDNYVELFGFVSIPAGPVTVNASLFRQDYQSVNSADFMQLSAGVLYPFQASNWTLTPALYLAKDKLNNNDFLTVTDIRFAASKNLAAHSRLLLRYRYSDISADTAAYNYLQGSRQQFRAQHTSLTAFGQLRLRYELELNDRQNLTTTNYSPTRHTLLVRLKQRLSQGWQTKEELSWRNSHYGEAAGVTRDDKRYQVNLNADKRLGKAFRGGMRYSHTNNNSNLAGETYSRNDVQAYINWLF
jgi:hypothetical protein